YHHTGGCADARGFGRSRARRRLSAAHPLSRRLRARIARGIRHERRGARCRLQSQQGTQALQIGALQEFQHLIADSRAVLEENARTLGLVRDSLGRMTAALTDSRRRVREALGKQVTLTKEMATENVAMLDSVKASLGSSLTPHDAAVLETEIQTAHTYQQISQLVDSGLDAAIARNPVFALQDSLGVRLARAQAMHD